jgi:hypothetical protein
VKVIATSEVPAKVPYIHLAYGAATPLVNGRDTFAGVGFVLLLVGAFIAVKFKVVGQGITRSWWSRFLGLLAGLVSTSGVILLILSLPDPMYVLGGIGLLLIPVGAIISVKGQVAGRSFWQNICICLLGAMIFGVGFIAAMFALLQP